jgi:hypothetical protein
MRRRSTPSFTFLQLVEFFLPYFKPAITVRVISDACRDADEACSVGLCRFVTNFHSLLTSALAMNRTKIV